MVIGTEVLEELRASQAQPVPGMAAVYVSTAGVEVQCVGVTSRGGAQRVDEHTVFEAASLSKPCFAMALLKLAEGGLFPLDEPLALHSERLRDAHLGSVTARHLLSHSSGLPNWSTAKRPFRGYFPAGERFSYSSEGFVCLQEAAESICGRSAQRLVRELVFEPLGMTRSSYVWESHFDDNYALPHDEEPAEPKWKPDSANVASSLHTTAADWGRFLRALLFEPAFEERRDSALAAAVRVPESGPLSLDGPLPLHPQLAWGLGWGLLPASQLFFQWGANAGFKALTAGSTHQQRACAVFCNGRGGLALAGRVTAEEFSEARAVNAWLGIQPA